MIDIDWNAPKTPCQNDWCDRPNYHVCIKPGTPDLFPVLLGEQAKRKHRKKPTERSEEHKLAISLSQIARWERIREENRKRDAEMVEMYIDGMSFRQLSAEFDVSKTVAVKVIHDAAEAGLLRVRPSNHALELDERNNKIVEAYKSGIEIPALSRQFNISRSVIQRILHTAKAEGKLALRPRWDKAAQAERNAKIIKLHEEGDHSLKQLGELFGISKASVVAIVKQQPAA